MEGRIGKFSNAVLLGGGAIFLSVFALLMWRHDLSLHHLAFIGLAVMLVLATGLQEFIRINSVRCGVSTLVAVYRPELLLTYSGTGITSLGIQAC